MGKKGFDNKYGKKIEPLMNISYRHTQFGAVLVASLLCAAILVAAAALKTGWNLVACLVELVVLGCAWLFAASPWRSKEVSLCVDSVSG